MDQEHRRWLVPLLTAIGLAALTACATRIPVDTAIRAPAADHEIVVDLRFVTNRELVRQKSGDNYIGAERGELSAGFCKAAFRANDRWGEILRIDSAPLESVLEVAPSERLVIYVHGYSESFDRSCRRAAVLQQRLRLDERLLLFSWPSRNYVSYTRDGRTLERSLDQLNTLLSRASESVGKDRIILMGHSMGTRGIVNALNRRREGGDRFHHVILLAPDIPRASFLEDVRSLQKSVADVTIYTSDNDLVLWLSTVVNASPRLGLANDIDIDPAHANVVDITSTGVSFVGGHLYHIFNAAVAEDLRTVLGSAVPGAGRAWQRVPGATAGLWQLEAS